MDCESDVYHQRFMKSALKWARDGLRSGQAPFGAVIVRDSQIISADHNRVSETGDIAAHAEVQAIRLACQKLGTLDLSDCTIYSTCEPCPMCYGAIYWSKINQIVFGASISDAEKAGLRQLNVSNEVLRSMSSDAIEIVSGVMHEENNALLREFGRFKRVVEP